MRTLILLGLLLAMPLSARAERRPIVLELYTSQGCSSCPPADALLSELARARPDLLPLGFHVDYWDRLGWADPFSSAANTARERLHAARLGDETIYTPELVVDGARSVVGSDRAEVTAAIAEAERRMAAGPAVTARRVGPDNLSISIGPGAGAAHVLLVGFDRSHTTPIGRGENGGRTLQESNVVRSLTMLADWRGAATEQVQPWPRGERAAVLLESDDGHIIGAAATP